MSVACSLLCCWIGSDSMFFCWTWSVSAPSTYAFVIWSFTYSFCLDYYWRITLVPALSIPVCGACLFDCVALVLDLSLVPGLGSWVCVPSAAGLILWILGWQWCWIWSWWLLWHECTIRKTTSKLKLCFVLLSQPSQAKPSHSLAGLRH